MKTIKDIADKYGGKKLNDIPGNLKKIFRNETQQIEVAHYLNHLWTDLQKSFIEDIKEYDNKDGDYREVLEYIKKKANITEEDLK